MPPDKLPNLDRQNWTGNVCLFQNSSRCETDWNSGLPEEQTELDRLRFRWLRFRFRERLPNLERPRLKEPKLDRLRFRFREAKPPFYRKAKIGQATKLGYQDWTGSACSP